MKTVRTALGALVASLLVVLLPGLVFGDNWSADFALYNKDEYNGPINVSDKTFYQQVAIENTGYCTDKWQWKHYYQFSETYLEYYYFRDTYGGCTYEGKNTPDSPCWWMYEYPRLNPAGDWSTTQVKFTALDDTEETILYVWLSGRHHNGLWWTDWSTLATDHIELTIYE